MRLDFSGEIIKVHPAMANPAPSHRLPERTGAEKCVVRAAGRGATRVGRFAVIDGGGQDMAGAD
jgi:hypothetical protein